MRNPKVVFIAGVDLSGSTVVDLAIGSLPGYVGLGEIDNVLDSHKRNTIESQGGNVEKSLCTCGKSAERCSVWGPTLKFISSEEGASFPTRLLKLMDAAHHAANAEYFVDSSKQISALKKHRLFERELYESSADFSILLLRRGPVDWLMSDFRRASRRGQRRDFRIARRRVKKWEKRYRELIEFAERSLGPVGHMSLRAFQKEPRTLVRTLRGMGLPVSEDSEEPNLSKTKSHVVWGSHHRLDQQRASRVVAQPGESIFGRLRATLVVLTVPRAITTNLRMSRLERQ